MFVLLQSQNYKTMDFQRSLISNSVFLLLWEMTVRFLILLPWLKFSSSFASLYLHSPSLS